MNISKSILPLLLIPVLAFGKNQKPSFESLELKADSLWHKSSFVQLRSVLNDMLEISERENNSDQKVETLIHLHEYEAYYQLNNNLALDHIINAIEIADKNPKNIQRLKTRSKLIYFHQTTTQDEELVLQVLDEMKSINDIIGSEFYTYVNEQWEAQIIGTLRLLEMPVKEVQVKKAVATIKETLNYFDADKPDEVFYHQQARRCVVGFFPDFFDYDECLNYIDQIKRVSHKLRDPINESSNLIVEGTFYALNGQHKLLIKCLDDNEDKLEKANHGISKFYYQLLLSAYQATNDYKNALISAQKMHFHDQEVNQTAFANKLEAIHLSKESQEIRLKNELLNLRNYLFYGISGLLSLGLILTYVAFQKIKNQNLTINEQKLSLEQINQSKNKLFGILSHDLKGPISSLHQISEKIHLLANNKEWDRLDKMTNQINIKTHNLHQILENILPWMSAQMKNPKANLEELSLRSFLDDLVNEMNYLIINKNLIIENHVPLDCKVSADRQSLKIVIRNILNNSIKFTKNGGKISFNTKQPKNGLLNFSISDTGVGIASDVLENIFTDYSSSLGTLGEHGNGLGLKLSKDLMVAMGGDLKIRSVLDEGSTVDILVKIH